jgi:ribonucleoside-diphosphate reductase alpha chain
LEEHLPVFDCAFKPAKGKRSIHYRGHIRMVAAVQPFLSGAISKTVNMPNEATVDDIMQTYMEGWKQGLKSIAIYRDGCKRTQPLNTIPGEKGKPSAMPARPYRKRLPDTRRAITHKFSVGGHEGYITVGMYEDGAPGEIFLTMAKEGSVVSGLVDCFATAISMTLQYGVPLRVLVDKFSHVRFEPAGWTSNSQIRMAKSIVDYIFRWLASQFLPPEEWQQIGILDSSKRTTANDVARAEEEVAGLLSLSSPAAGVTGLPSLVEPFPFKVHDDAPPCPDCGAIMVRNGTCYKCLNCGATSGCS